MLKKYGSAKLDPSWDKQTLWNLQSHESLCFVASLLFTHVTLDPTTLSTTKTFHILLNWHVLNTDF